MVRKNQKRQESRDYRYKILSAIRDRLPKSRPAMCGLVPTYQVQSGQAVMSIRKTADGRAYFEGQAVCGSVWGCPVCNPKIATGRKNEINRAMKLNYERGGDCFFLTMTFSHEREDVLPELIDKFSKALSRMKASKEWKKLREAIGYRGSIRALEFTHSNRNGWHPHSHDIVFTDKKISVFDAKFFEYKLYLLWRKYAVKYGLGEPSRGYGVRVVYSHNTAESYRNLADYCSGFSYEITHTHTKKSTTDCATEYQGRTPWEILRGMADAEDKTQRTREVFLFKQFLNAVKGRAQLYWSPGLKDYFGIDDLADENLAEESEPGEVMYEMDDEEFYLVAKFRKHAEALAIAESHPLFLRSYFEKLKAKYWNFLFVRDERRKVHFTETREMWRARCATMEAAEMLGAA